MSLKYVSGYLMAVIAGNSEPSADDVRKIIGAVGGEIDNTILSKLISEMKGKTVHEVVAAGMEKLQSIPSGGAGGSAAPAAGGAAAAAPAEEAAPEEPEEEEEDDMGFSLFD